MSAENIRAIIEAVNTAIIQELVNRLTAQESYEFWDVVNAIGWGSYTTDYNAVKEALIQIYPPKDIEQMSEMAIKYREALQDRVKQYEQASGIDNLYDVSDDGFWDYTAHIVGLGKEAYSKAMNNPEQFVGMEYKENFEYSFNID